MNVGSGIQAIHDGSGDINVHQNNPTPLEDRERSTIPGIVGPGMHLIHSGEGGITAIQNPGAVHINNYIVIQNHGELFSHFRRAVGQTSAK